MARHCRSTLAVHRDRLSPVGHSDSRILVRGFADSVCVRPASRSHPLAVEAVLQGLSRSRPSRPVVLDLRQALLSDLMLEAVRRSLYGAHALPQAVRLVADRPFARRALRTVVIGRSVPLYGTVVAAVRGGRVGLSAPGCPHGAR